MTKALSLSNCVAPHGGGDSELALALRRRDGVAVRVPHCATLAGLAPGRPVLAPIQYRFKWLKRFSRKRSVFLLQVDCTAPARQRLDASLEPPVG